MLLINLKNFAKKFGGNEKFYTFVKLQRLIVAWFIKKWRETGSMTHWQPANCNGANSCPQKGAYKFKQKNETDSKLFYFLPIAVSVSTLVCTCVHHSTYGSNAYAYALLLLVTGPCLQQLYFDPMA